MTVLIDNLEFTAILGILDHERITPQRICVDCRLTYRYRPGIFVNYAEVAELIESTMQEKRFELIEEALEILGDLLKTRFPLIETASLTIRKPDILPNCSVGIRHDIAFKN